MKRIVSLLALIAALALCAGAQTYTIDFHEMPFATTPSLMPDFYHGLDWVNFYYVSPGFWAAEGPGFMPDSGSTYKLPHNTAIFVGGPNCPPAATCAASIKVASRMATSKVWTFRPASIEMCAGWKDNTVTVSAYYYSTFLGTWTVKLSTMRHEYSFPSIFPEVTQLVFTPGFIPSNTVKPPTAGSVVIYGLTLEMK